MIKLTDRLQKIADFIDKGETMADIGTDHGFLPIYLWQNNICPHVILSDINKGPLEKADNNINIYCPDNSFDVRLGSGLEKLELREVDDIVIAGMGGLLIINILSSDVNKSKSYKKFIFQPRNAPEKLKKWLLENGFYILDSCLVREGKYIWEIFLAVPENQLMYNNINNFKIVLNKDKITDPIDLEISSILYEKKDPLLVDFIKNKIKIEEKILNAISNSKNIKNKDKVNKIKERIVKLEFALKKAYEI
ncbi:tRNA (adenine(22)-N(1))-methyltransferase [Anaerovorax odorimutans]|uniref:tRNA (adenine(22)-N(1))-methyltransferase n=1 Tax=Anaerovorax odorimutans TaxID=109327 RepID=UPI000422651A|nr:class I SAM-dependent methyltransferase [Anaerovorax odorimutans]